MDGWYRLKLPSQLPTNGWIRQLQLKDCDWTTRLQKVLKSTKSKRSTLKLKAEFWISEDFYFIKNLKITIFSFLRSGWRAKSVRFMPPLQLPLARQLHLEIPFSTLPRHSLTVEFVTGIVNRNLAKVSDNLKFAALIVARLSKNLHLECGLGFCNIAVCVHLNRKDLLSEWGGELNCTEVQVLNLSISSGRVVGGDLGAMTKVNLRVAGELALDYCSKMMRQW